MEMCCHLSNQLTMATQIENKSAKLHNMELSLFAFLPWHHADQMSEGYEVLKVTQDGGHSLSDDQG